jgi:2-oxoglutarate dehydrogenase E1 component
LATSPLESLSHGEFETVIDEIDPIEAEEVTRVVMCSGKVYYDLLQARRSRELQHVAIVRIEQLYPFPHDRVSEVVGQYINAEQFIWCQEEPQNQGAWDQIKHRFAWLHERGLRAQYAGRKSAAAPATGYSKVHQEEQDQLIDDALTGEVNREMDLRG